MSYLVFKKEIITRYLFDTYRIRFPAFLVTQIFGTTVFIPTYVFTHIKWLLVDEEEEEDKLCLSTLVPQIIIKCACHVKFVITLYFSEQLGIGRGADAIPTGTQPPPLFPPLGDKNKLLSPELYSIMTNNLVLFSF